MNIDDTYFIRKTFALAKKAEGFTSPNPLVGAVIVKKGKIISWGYHKKAGLPHAEIEAIRKAKGDLRDSTLYVNLEPCYHFGRTPPCVDQIIKNKINRVVVATCDPNPLVNGKSIKKLRKAGIEVKVGVLEDEAKKLNEVFFKNMLKRRPFVVVKVAQSLDGKITTRDGISKWITQKDSRDFAKSLRDKYDCVLVGVNTVIKDNPSLNGARKIPFKVVIDPHLRIPLGSKIFKKTADKLVIFTSIKNIKKADKFSPAKIFFLKKKNKYFCLEEILNNLYKIGIMSVFVEGGSETIGRFFDYRLVDKIYFFIAPKIIGGKKALTSVGGEGYRSLGNSPYLEDFNIKRIGKDILIWGYPVYKKRK
jgi:diaminohydroxyphosphoribosylaminopyrimidine deaminase/5-amino-6-(5-phosphoribosylamino)uracil reductase